MTLFRFNLFLTLVVSPNCGVSGEGVEIDGSRIPDVNKKARRVLYTNANSANRAYCGLAHTTA
jgi:hypothetical protein